MKIAIVQFYSYHEEVLAPQIDFLCHKYEVFLAAPESVFKNDYIFHLLDSVSPIIFRDIKKNKLFTLFNKLSIIGKYQKLLNAHRQNNFDLVIFNTITKNFHYSLIKFYFKRLKKIQIIHNGKHFLKKNNLKFLNIFDNNLFLSQDIYKRFRETISPYSAPLNWFCPLLSEKFVSHNKPGIAFDSQYINIAVPGSVNEKRRNYSSLFAALENYRNKPALKFRIYLLGKISDRMLDKLKKHGIENIVFFYQKFISGCDMLNCIKNADAVAFLLDSGMGGSFHDYNNNKVSGTTNLCLSFGVPCIVSDEYKLETALQEKAVFYKNDNIASILENIENGSLTKGDFKKLSLLSVDKLYYYENQQKHYLNAIGLD